MNDLIFNILGFVREFLPKAVMIENVPGLAKDGRIFSFKSHLETLGYQCDHDVFNAKDFGAPQSRKRMIFMAIRQAGVICVCFRG